MTGCTCGGRQICVECVLAELGWTADDALAVLEDRFVRDAARGQARLEAAMAAGELTERGGLPGPSGHSAATPPAIRKDVGSPRSVSSPVEPAFGNVVELHGWSRRVAT